MWFDLCLQQAQFRFERTAFLGDACRFGFRQLGTRFQQLLAGAEHEEADDPEKDAGDEARVVAGEEVPGFSQDQQAGDEQPDAQADEGDQYWPEIPAFPLLQALSQQHEGGVDRQADAERNRQRHAERFGHADDVQHDRDRQAEDRRQRVGDDDLAHRS